MNNVKMHPEVFQEVVDNIKINTKVIQEGVNNNNKVDPTVIQEGVENNKMHLKYYRRY